MIHAKSSPQSTNNFVASSRSSSVPGTLAGKVAIITGGARGVGYAVSMKIASLGAKVIVVGLPGDPVPEVVENIRAMGGSALAWIGDVAVEGQAESCIAEAVEAFGQIDILIHLHSTSSDAVPTEHCRTFDFDRALYSDLRSVFLMTRFALPYLRETKGVLIASGGTSSPSAGLAKPIHFANRAWVTAFISQVAIESSGYGLRVSVVPEGGPDEADQFIAIAKQISNEVVDFSKEPPHLQEPIDHRSEAPGL
jgi:NAD(P)-dependent dehydrogenase (short-subunit alcohol dehydrogenase family)